MRTGRCVLAIFDIVQQQQHTKMRFKRRLCFSMLFVKTSGDGLLVCGAHDQSWCRWNAQQNTRAGHKESNMVALEGHSWESGGSTLRVAVRLCMRPCRLMNAVEATPVSQLDQPCWPARHHHHSQQTHRTLPNLQAQIQKTVSWLFSVIYHTN